MPPFFLTKIRGQTMKEYTKKRLQERSTWAGIGVLLSSMGIAIAPAYFELIAAVVGLIVTLIPTTP